eukprot:TRINITY_DN1870_c0_g1_i2.p1 TRINITY_DN1870_c0_g1~~TRINITY_DN1870_c0_g1_i2.p1  ORF type:complete len:250 (+),score=85.20 TRINITY_DN1870_c0_g1_i2:95-844(+)
MEELSDCTICLNKIEDCGILECKHVFCFNCIVEWTKISSTCPLCKKEVRRVKSKTTNKVVNIKEKKQVAEFEEEDYPIDTNEFLEFIEDDGYDIAMDRDFLLTYNSDEDNDFFIGDALYEDEEDDSDDYETITINYIEDDSEILNISFIDDNSQISNNSNNRRTRRTTRRTTRTTANRNNRSIIVISSSDDEDEEEDVYQEKSEEEEEEEIIIRRSSRNRTNRLNNITNVITNLEKDKKKEKKKKIILI